MRSKLTLRMDEDSIERAKRYAADRGISVSRLVENFFEALTSDDEDDQMSPLVKELWGTLEGTDVSEADYDEHLEERHL